MRRAVSLIMAALGLVGVAVAAGGAAVAAPAPASLPSAVAPGKKRCTVADERLRELSGLVATRSGYIVINDGTDVESRKRVFFLDSKCEVTKDVSYSGGGPFDTEDLALSPDSKTLWIADTGDNVTSKNRRDRVAVWSMPVSGSKKPQLHRLSYPEGKHHDAEALLINSDGSPLVITKVTSGKAKVFTPDGKLKTGDTEPVPMKQVGEITLPKTATENPFNTFGRVAITGAARSPDGTRVVLRTYADAFEYDVSNGDVLAAVTTGKPKVTPLADPFGEAIAYTPDGKSFLTVSDGGQMEEDEPIEILSYTPSTEGAKPVAGEDDGQPKKASLSWFDSLSLQDITYLIAAVGVIGALLVGAGIVGILRARKRGAGSSGDDADGRDPDDDLPDNRRIRPDDDRSEPDARRGGVYGGPAGGGVYGGGRGGPPAGGGDRGGRAGGGGRGGAPAGGGVYGGGRPAGGGGVYGGGRPADGGGVYGGGRPNGRPAGGGGGVYGGQPGGGYGGGGRAEPPRRGGPEQDPRGQRPGRRRDGGYDDGRGSYGQVPGRGYRGDRY
ncbi:hypothetical protein Q3W71_02305 [Micromonospora sp. C28SCA-DRY-2]|uniref:hypothetical protein n=1 Tax=Micromonospora sp. C28SCA-DRY-2 TaxID=3059522 RepID=UPI0026768473|nr:hypothetical protein [Micromonospora sp. C28SCA-DRY-2]MDO3700510.1 hypothetical protein [Micromonospora sp. C28SCA-DRY-2]